MKSNILATIIAVFAFVIFTGFTIAEKKPKLKKIFNGKNLDGWRIPDGNIWWLAENGVLSCKSGPEKKGSILWTEQVYSDFIFQADFKFGKGTVDSGVFIRNEEQQIQIGESGSLKRDMTCSPYIPGKGYPAEAQGIKELLKKDGWNTIRIKAVGKVYTMWLNGEEVLEFKSETAIEKGPIGLQLHGNRDMQIDFRKIMAAEL